MLVSDYEPPLFFVHLLMVGLLPYRSILLNTQLNLDPLHRIV